MGRSARRRFFALGTTPVAQGAAGAVTDISQYLMDVSLSSTRATEFDTTYDPAGTRRFEQTRIGLLTDGSMSASGRWQQPVHRLLAAARAAVLADNEGRGLPFAHGPLGYARDDIMELGTMILTSFSMSFPKTGINDFQLQGQINGALTQATLGIESDAAARLAALDPARTLMPADFVHGVAGFRTCVFMGGYPSHRWFDTFSVNGSVGTAQDGGFKPPGDRQEYLSTYGDHTFSAAGPWLPDYHQRLVDYLELPSGQIITVIPGTSTGNGRAGDVALLFRALQTQFDLQGRNDDKVMHSLSLEAGDNIAINGVWFGSAAAPAAAPATTGADVDAATIGVDFADSARPGLAGLRQGNGIINVHLTGGPQNSATFAVDHAPASGVYTNIPALDLEIDGSVGSGVIQMPAEWPTDAEHLRIRLKTVGGTLADTPNNRAIFTAAFGI